jgi:hypothetical protein
MNELTVTLLILTNVFIAALLGVLVYFIVKLVKEDRKRKEAPENQSNVYHPQIEDRIQGLKNLKPVSRDLFCPNHPDEPGEAQCAICDELFCRVCIRPFKTLHYCKEHLALIMRHDWVEVLTLKTSTTDPEEGVRLYDRKKTVFQSNGFPTYVETHYKIDVDSDHIETYLKLFAIDEQADQAKSLFSELPKS